jgi:PAS domain S-box-containing protein
LSYNLKLCEKPLPESKMQKNPEQMSHEELIEEVHRLREGEAANYFMRKVFDAFPEGLCVESEQGEFIDFNQTAAVMHGYTREEFMAITPFDLMSDETKRNLPDLQQREMTNGSLHISIKTVCKNGDLLPVEMITRLFTVGERTFRFLIILKRKASEEYEVISEEAVKSLKDFMPDIMGEPEIVIEMDTKGFIKSANRNFFETTGYTKQDFLKKLSIEKIVVPEQRIKANQALKKVLSGDIADLEEFIGVKKDGTTIPFLVHSARIEENGVIRGVRIFAMDITDQKTFEKRLLDMEKFHALGEVSGGVMHDLKNICTVLLGYIELLLIKELGQPGCKECKNIYDKMKKAAMDGAYILKRAQNFGETCMEKETEMLDINDLINDVVDMYRSKWEAETQSRGVKIFIVKDLSPLPRINANPSELREVFGNIILNAIEATHVDGVITIKSVFSENTILITVSDTGIGIQKELMPKVFEPFFTTKGEKGTGLGLFVTQNIIHSLGGGIEIDSAVGEGTSFIVTLPLSFSDNYANKNSDPAVSKGERILVIDDEKNICDILEEFLSMAGFDVKTVQDGKTGLDAFEKHCFDAVITDFNMPGMSGLELAKIIKQNYPSMKIIMLTGWGTGIHELNNREMLVDSILHKPVSYQKLISSVKEVLGIE